MAVPKKKSSRTRRDRRRAQWKISVPTLARCKQCGEVVLPFYACPNCGNYKGRKVVVTHSEKLEQRKAKRKARQEKQAQL